MLGDLEDIAGAGHQGCGPVRESVEAFGEGGGAQRLLIPVAAVQVDRLGVADDRDVDDPLEQVGLGAEADVDGAVPDGNWAAAAQFAASAITGGVAR
ncbi:hypothetical protein [Amycolatopsis pithecellobii]|uniref:Uncharacterized protein n=1 Tax=Amycolatopsis pithecellobii TaxID=664692 RepID=A0A6N7YLF1_9PSEU|nr:hypothetical protein [Amycolatopsis pithecellobii]MTD53755.1 hypothetical protein [Amycolatopsis pithecellobii]